jgi:hypothetical protein
MAQEQTTDADASTEDADIGSRLLGLCDRLSDSLAGARAGTRADQCVDSWWLAHQVTTELREVGLALQQRQQNVAAVVCV